ncbi:MAG: NrsF family protein [Burkholderiales bacterium]
MKTDDLTLMLSRNAGAVSRHESELRHLCALLLGISSAAVLMWLVLGVRPDLDRALGVTLFWVKPGFPAALFAGAVIAFLRLSVPGRSPGRVAVMLGTPLIILWFFSAVSLLSAPDDAVHDLVFGKTWASCPLLVTVLSMPQFAATFWLLHELAPTKPVATGAVAGLLSGCVGAFFYAFYCPESSLPFIGIWYVLGILIPAAAGAVLGHRLLRW